MRIVLLSDTHGYLDPAVFGYLASCDEVWHAGDLGDAAVLHQLQQYKPVRAVFGNIDDHALQQQLPEDIHWECQGLRIWMTHIGGAPPHYNPRVRKILQQQPPHVFICGHSHILRVKRDANFQNMLYVNPGAAGNHGFHTIKTLLRFEIAAGRLQNMEAVELGRRGALT
jgi:hypothetical protein